DQSGAHAGILSRVEACDHIESQQAARTGRRRGRVKAQSKLVVLIAAASCGGFRCSSGSVVASTPATETVVYTNRFSDPVGTSYPEWSLAGYSWTGNQAGTIAAGAATEKITNIDSANGSQRFLGELGGPTILTAPPYDREHFVRVDESITLSLVRLP